MNAARRHKTSLCCQVRLDPDDLLPRAAERPGSERRPLLLVRLEAAQHRLQGNRLSVEFRFRLPLLLCRNQQFKTAVHKRFSYHERSFVSNPLALKANLFVGKFQDQTFHVVGRVRARAPLEIYWLTPPWGSAPPPVKHHWFKRITKNADVVDS